jgi:hypothetical protein
MKMLVGFAVAGALLAGVQTVQAQTVPSSGTSDLWLFVADGAKSETFAVDTGVTVSSLLNSFTSNASLQKVNDAFSQSASQISSTGALANFISTNSGDGLQWGVLGVNWPSTSTSTSGSGPNATPGGTVGIFSAGTGGSAGSSAKSMQLAGMVSFASTFNTDAGYLAGGYTAGGGTYLWSAGSAASGQVWFGPPGGPSAGSVTEYGAGPSQLGFAPGSSVDLYGVTGNNSVGTVQSYVLGQLTLGTDGSLSLTQSSAPVPLPAAVWLLGSGLLGLAGIGRRRTASAA